MPTESYVALLRGINVGGKNLLPMKALVEIFAAAECTEVESYIQSGNVIFKAAKIEGVAAAVRTGIERQFGLKVPVILRTAAEMKKTATENPLLERGTDPASLHVVFLERVPTPAQRASLDPNRSSPDEFIVAGKVVYLSLPHGAAKTKLTAAYFDAKLKTVGTQRNWRTVLTLAKMMGVTA